MAQDLPVTYKPSQYSSAARDDDGALILANHATGAIGVVPADEAATAAAALRPATTTDGPLAGVLRDLAHGGFLVPSTVDEHEAVRASYLARYVAPNLHLILMPTEQCNLRCVYCYESFVRGEMSAEVQDGIRRLVERQRGLRRLTISWFGGEPLLAPEIVVGLTGDLRRHCEARGITFICGATTNGTLLTPELAERLIGAGVKTFQISLDGLEHHHDAHRRGPDGEPSHAQIIDNLRALARTDLDFSVSIRHNVDAANIGTTRDFYRALSTDFGADERFTTDVKTIGQWGGPNDDDLAVCTGHATYRALVDVKQHALDVGFRPSHATRMLEPNGAACYAADPRSFVVGPEGRLYKCTVELDYHDRNIVGQLNQDGSMDLDWDKMALWCETDGMRPGTKCSGCSLGAACHGAVCPKEWMDERECACPDEKHAISRTLKLVRRARQPA